LCRRRRSASKTSLGRGGGGRRISLSIALM
jgi:hypothetical protein